METDLDFLLELKKESLERLVVVRTQDIGVTLRFPNGGYSGNFPKT